MSSSTNLLGSNKTKNNTKKNISISSLLSSHGLDEKYPDIKGQYYDATTNTITALPSLNGHKNDVIVIDDEDDVILVGETKHNKQDFLKNLLPTPTPPPPLMLLLLLLLKVTNNTTSTAVGDELIYPSNTNRTHTPSLLLQPRQQQILPIQQRSTKVSLMSIMNDDNPIPTPTIPIPSPVVIKDEVKPPKLTRKPRAKKQTTPSSAVIDSRLKKQPLDLKKISSKNLDLNTTIIIDGKPVVIPNKSKPTAVVKSNKTKNAHGLNEKPNASVHQPPKKKAKKDTSSTTTASSSTDKKSSTPSSTDKKSSTPSNDKKASSATKSTTTTKKITKSKLNGNNINLNTNKTGDVIVAGVNGVPLATIPGTQLTPKLQSPLPLQLQKSTTPTPKTTTTPTTTTAGAKSGVNIAAKTVKKVSKPKSVKIAPQRTIQPPSPPELKQVVTLPPPKLVDVKPNNTVEIAASVTTTTTTTVATSPHTGTPTPKPDIDRLDPLAVKKITEPVVEEPIISLHIPLTSPDQPPGSAQVVFNITKLCEEKYGWKVIHPGAKFAMDELNEDDDMDDMEDDDEEMEEVDKTKKDNAAEKEDENTNINNNNNNNTTRPKKKELSFEAKMNRKIGKYDYEDPFIDDAELLWDEQQVSTKDGFFVYYGPLFEEGQNVRIEKLDSKNGTGGGRTSGGGGGGGTAGNGNSSSSSSNSTRGGVQRSANGVLLSVNGKPIGNPHRGPNGRFSGLSLNLNLNNDTATTPNITSSSNSTNSNSNSTAVVALVTNERENSGGGGGKPLIAIQPKSKASTPTIAPALTNSQ